MKALVIFKRTNAGQLQLCGEIRPYGCFNGFNVDGAFRRKRELTDFIFDLGTNGFPTHVGMLGGTAARDASGLDNSWEFIGIGWLSDRAGTSYASMSGDGISGRYNEAKMLNRETCMPQYYDGMNDEWVHTKRQCTPNEILVGKAMITLIKQTVTPPVEACESSQLIRALYTSWSYGAMMDFDFVGSERSSGMAVAYLQVYRNASRRFTGRTNYQANELNALTGIAASQSVKSLIPYLSVLCHSGGDSDIFSHTSGATGYVAAQATFNGIFSLQPFMERTDSMVIQGRYAKGNQSAALGRNIMQAARRPGQVALDEDGWASLMGQLAEVIRAKNSLTSVMRMETLQSYGLERFRSELDRALAAYGQAPTGGTVSSRLNQLMSVVRTYDLNIPVTPIPAAIDATRVVGAAQGFTQWVAATDARFGDTITRQQTDADRARSVAAGTPI